MKHTRHPYYVIPIDDLINGGLYYISSRSSLVGIWRKDKNGKYGFQILRNKYGALIIDFEYHWDSYDSIYNYNGTVKPIMFIEICPNNLLVDNIANTIDEYLKIQEPLNLYLIDKEKQIREMIK